MPVIDRSNNKILSANARASDVAEKAIVEIAPVQQLRYYSAFRVQGLECIHYNRLTAGRKCVCQSVDKRLNSILDEDGKASTGTINRMLTGGLSFDVTPYGTDQNEVHPGSSARGETSPNAPVNKHQGVFDLWTTTPPEIPFTHEELEGFGDNGPVTSVDVNQLFGDFDDGMQYGDASCAVCFGTGFIGGYAPFHAHRQVLTVDETECVGTIDMSVRPWSMETDQGLTAVVTLPRGAIGVDAFRVMNGTNVVAASITVNGLAVRSVNDILRWCDGARHLFGAQFKGVFTHVELQFRTSDESLYIEFPRRPSSNNTALLEQMEPFQIILSGNIPSIDSQDLVYETQLGKILLVQNANPWISRQRHNFGWEAMVRVIQPTEVYRAIPARGRIVTKDRTTMMARDNQNGPRRT